MRSPLLLLLWCYYCASAATTEGVDKTRGQSSLAASQA